MNKQLSKLFNLNRSKFAFAKHAFVTGGLRVVVFPVNDPFEPLFAVVLCVANVVHEDFCCVLRFVARAESSTRRHSPVDSENAKWEAVLDLSHTGSRGNTADMAAQGSMDVEEMLHGNELDVYVFLKVAHVASWLASGEHTVVAVETRVFRDYLTELLWQRGRGVHKLFCVLMFLLKQVQKGLLSTFFENFGRVDIV